MYKGLFDVGSLRQSRLRGVEYNEGRRLCLCLNKTVEVYDRGTGYWRSPFSKLAGRRHQYSPRMADQIGK